MYNDHRRESRTGLYVTLGICLLVILIGGGVIAAPHYLRWRNEFRFELQTIHDQTDYTTLRRVEDTARAMVATWEGDRLQWEQFKDSDVQEERNWANGALMRANRTATSFNNFILENSFVWAYGVPDDLQEPLPILSRN